MPEPRSLDLGHQARERGRCDPASPLADKRGPGARSRAIRDAILQARKTGSDEEQIERVILAACQRGLPGVQDRLF
jgi:hypothetical protein